MSPLEDCFMIFLFLSGISLHFAFHRLLNHNLSLTQRFSFVKPNSISDEFSCA